jgi:hypothetical protein
VRAGAASSAYPRRNWRVRAFCGFPAVALVAMARRGVCASMREAMATEGIGSLLMALEEDAIGPGW